MGVIIEKTVPEENKTVNLPPNPDFGSQLNKTARKSIIKSCHYPQNSDYDTVDGKRLNLTKKRYPDGDVSVLSYYYF